LRGWRGEARATRFTPRPGFTHWVRPDNEHLYPRDVPSTNVPGELLCLAHANPASEVQK